MTLDKMKRVVWRLKEMKTKEPGIYTADQIRTAIMEEIGTDQRTIKLNMAILRELKLLVPVEMGKMKLGEIII